MVSIEQVKLLEKKVSKAIEYVTRVCEENTLLKARMEGYQKRIGELEVLIQRFKEDQGRIEESIVSSINQLNKLEEQTFVAIPPNSESLPDSPPERSVSTEEDTAGEDTESSEDAEDEQSEEEAESGAELDIF